MAGRSKSDSRKWQNDVEIIINYMAKNDKHKEIDLNEMAITLEVDSDVIGKVRGGEIKHLAMDINEGNQNLILENINGSLVLVTDEMPTMYHGCYFYNGGVFPYAIKSTLDFLILDAGEDGYAARGYGMLESCGARSEAKSLTRKATEGDSFI